MSDGAGFLTDCLFGDTPVRHWIPQPSGEIPMLEGGEDDGDPRGGPGGRAQYSTALHSQVGGDYLHGDYSRNDFLDTLTTPSGDESPLSNWRRLRSRHDHLDVSGPACKLGTASKQAEVENARSGRTKVGVTAAGSESAIPSGVVHA